MRREGALSMGHFARHRATILGKNYSVVMREIGPPPVEDLGRKIASLRNAEAKAFVTCANKALCDKAFSLTQIYINQTSDLLVQGHATAA
jgi:predicted transcriptional regulator